MESFPLGEEHLGHKILEDQQERAYHKVHQVLLRL